MFTHIRSYFFHEATNKMRTDMDQICKHNKKKVHILTLFTADLDLLTKSSMTKMNLYVDIFSLRLRFWPISGVILFTTSWTKWDRIFAKSVTKWEIFAKMMNLRFWPIPGGYRPDIGQNRKSSVNNINSAINNRKSAVDNRRSAVDHRRSTVDNRISAVDNRRSAVDNRRSAVDNRKSAVNSTKDQPSTLEKISRQQ